MATPSEKLAAALESLQQLQATAGAAAVRSGDLSRACRERLLANGFLQLVIKGWYIPSRPDEPKGESTPWYASYWRFSAAYLQERFGDKWSLSPEQSLSLLAGNRTVPRQLVVRSPKARNNVTPLPHGTSLLEVRAAVPARADQTDQDGLRLFSPESALIAASPNYYMQHGTDVKAVLLTLRDSSGLLAPLLDGGHSVIAGRLAGALRNVGRPKFANEILKAMTAAGYDVRESDPFSEQWPAVKTSRETSPYVNRIRLLWQKMREPVIECFPPAPGLPRGIEKYMKRVADAYVTDAYHSLSIEGYQVSRALIERVRAGAWNPDADQDDREQHNAMAARGYWHAFQSVQRSVRKVLRGDNAGTVAAADHRDWYRELFAPAVVAGLLKPSDLAGYRNGQVFIRGSMHVPLKREAVWDAMPALFSLLKEEPHPAVRAVLGHFVFVYIHPYMDGNGRVGRFLMNVMLASGGYPWTIVPVGQRKTYLEALEKSSVGEDIVPFARFLASLVRNELAGKPLPPVPS